MLPITATSLTPTPAFGNIHSKFFQTWRPPEATQLMTPGTQLGSYEILSPLGKGGMGEVWRARDSKLGREVAIKTLPEEFAKDEERLARFEREAKLLASLNHPNIAAIYGLEEDNDTRFLVLELVEGDTLAERLKRGAIPVEESLKLALQIAEALEAAHEKGVIHRDLKPANIKVTPDDKIKVLDFGLAKAFAGDGTDASVSQSPTLSMAATQQGVILGTAAYMSPEQARGQEVDKRADVWAAHEHSKVRCRMCWPVFWRRNHSGTRCRWEFGCSSSLSDLAIARRACDRTLRRRFGTLPDHCGDPERRFLD